ncbi:MAG: protein-glutamate O-methyltransferase [Desulfobacterales bacterium]
MNLGCAELDLNQFNKISALVYRASGINLKQGKEALVRARLMKRLRSLGVERVEDYLAFIDSEQGVEEVACLIDVMTTNKTSFFREVEHFHFLRDRVLPELALDRVRLWSAACSSGEEPYSLAMILCEHLKGLESRDVRILASDISRQMIAKARRAVYPQTVAAELRGSPYAKYFAAAAGDGEQGCRVVERVRNLVHFAHLNLMEAWPMKGPFQVIFCRNVMIYFDRPTQQELVNRFWDYLAAGGYLFVGHSEGLSAIRHRFTYMRPAVYQKAQATGGVLGL